MLLVASVFVESERGVVNKLQENLGVLFERTLELRRFLIEAVTSILCLIITTTGYTTVVRAQYHMEARVLRVK